MKRLLWLAMIVASVVIVPRLRSCRFGSRSQSTRDEARPADVILVLGAAEYRGTPLARAARPSRPRIRPVPAEDGPADHDHRRRRRRPDFHRRRCRPSYLMSRGVPSEAIIVESEGRKHRRIHRHGRRDHEPHGPALVVVVTDGYHIYRVKRMLQSQGFAVYGSPRKEQRSVSLPRSLELCAPGHRLSALARGSRCERHNPPPAPELLRLSGLVRCCKRSNPSAANGS